MLNHSVAGCMAPYFDGRFDKCFRHGPSAIFSFWTSPFPILVMLGDIFHLFPNFKKKIYEQIGKILIRHRIMR